MKNMKISSRIFQNKWSNMAGNLLYNPQIVLLWTSTTRDMELYYPRREPRECFQLLFRRGKSLKSKHSHSRKKASLLPYRAFEMQWCKHIQLISTCLNGSLVSSCLKKRLNWKSSKLRVLKFLMKRRLSGGQVSSSSQKRPLETMWGRMTRQRPL